MSAMVFDDYRFVVQAKEDGIRIYERHFNNALEAVEVFQRFRDLGDARETREVILVEPNGSVHAKAFRAPRRATLNTVQIPT